MKKAKTLVKAEHLGCGENGLHGCHTRWSTENGECSGVSTAKWLNSLGPDDKPYNNSKVTNLTNGQVRRNWIKNPSGHIKELETK